MRRPTAQALAQAQIVHICSLLGALMQAKGPQLFTVVWQPAKAGWTASHRADKISQQGYTIPASLAGPLHYDLWYF